MMQKILLLGGTGFLGGKIAETAPPDVELWLAYHNRRPASGNAVRVDLLDSHSLAQTLQRLQPDVIIHAARIHPADDDAVKAATATDKLAMTANVIGATLIYVSTDAIFDGWQGNYHEDDAPNPVTGYGKAKWAAEEVIQGRSRKYIIIRTSYIYGRSHGQWDKRTAEMLQQVSARHEVKYFQDHYRSPTWVDDLANACWQLVKKKFTGVIHVAGEKKSFFQFYQELAGGLDVNLDLIKPEQLKNLHLVFAHDTSLNTDLAKTVINFRPRPIADVCRAIYG